MRPEDVFYGFAIVSLAVTINVSIFMLKAKLRMEKSKKKYFEERNLPNKPAKDIEITPDQMGGIMTSETLYQNHKAVMMTQFACFIWAIAGFIFSDMRILFFTWLLCNNIIIMVVPLVLGKNLKVVDIILCYTGSVITCLLILYKHFF